MTTCAFIRMYTQTIFIHILCLVVIMHFMFGIPLVGDFICRNLILLDGSIFGQLHICVHIMGVLGLPFASSFNLSELLN